MRAIKLKFLYGAEFWEELEKLLKSAKQRVFLISAYIRKEDFDLYNGYIPSNVFRLVMCRDDNQKKGYFPPKALTVNHNYFHGKIYLIDNTIIIGSQNLYNAKKEGEFSTMITTDFFNSSLILYQALIKIIEKENVQPEPIHSDFLDFYSEGCPFCGNSFIPDPYTLIKCPGYGFGFVSEDDCEGYGDEGACKYCTVENRENIGECYCCDDSGCGFGISVESLKLIYHAINPVTEEQLVKAKKYLSLFNYFKNHNMDAIKIFKNLGFIGKVYSTSLKRDEYIFINYEIVKKLKNKLRECEKKLINK